MGKVAAPLAMSLDEFIADKYDGCEELFGFYGSGDVPLELSEGFPELWVGVVPVRRGSGWTQRVPQAAGRPVASGREAHPHRRLILVVVGGRKVQVQTH